MRRNRCVTLRACAITALTLAIGIAAAPAQDVAQEAMQGPRVSAVLVDWDAVIPELRALDSPDASQSTAGEGSKGPLPAAADIISRVNLAAGERFANIAASPVPVLLPFDTPAFLRDREGAPHAWPAEAGNYLSGFDSVPFFYAGPGGYDAVVVARAQEMRELGISFPDPIAIHIGGSALLHELDEPAGMIEWPVTRLDEFPGIRRVFLENYARYAFVRYGVPYVIAIECFDGGSRFRKISCRDADKVAIHALKALRFAGGAPQQRIEGERASTIDQPDSRSTVFTYYGPGNIIPGTGFKRKAGVADHTVYSKIRFPMADAPAFANSQSFTNWGDCEAAGRNGMGTRGGIGAYRCRASGQSPVWNEAVNYSYPWRDNFCESRAFYVGQCPGGLGHQGQDIRPAFCRQRGPGARCEPHLHDVVAVRDGAVLRAPNQESLYIVVNAPSERIRFRYLHMSPKQFDAAGMVSGRLVQEAEVIGKVGNFYRREGATTTHLHFDLQVPTRYGWVFVNPYMTLVAAYERLIGGRGQEIKEEIAADVPTGAFASEPASPAPFAGPAGLAAKPTETAVESSPVQRIDPGNAAR
jgi:murein DD-endopeptidase MepM/ murein hydrolase activator NlpD